MVLEKIVRENVLRELANQAATDPHFLRQARQDLEGVLVRHSYRLTTEEMRLVEGLRWQTSRTMDEELARMVADDLEGRRGSPPARPATPIWRGTEFDSVAAAVLSVAFVGRYFAVTLDSRVDLPSLEGQHR